MITATLTALIEAGKSSLSAARLPVEEIRISPVGAQEIAFTRLAVLVVVNSTLRRGSLGADKELAGQLKPAGSVADGGQTFPGLCEHYLDTLIAGLPVRHAEGSFQILDARSHSLYTPGVRAYGLRLKTDRGALFVVAEFKGSDFESSLVHAHLPRDFASVTELKSKRAIEGALLYLRKMETDIQFELSAGADHNLYHSGVLWGQSKYEDQRCLRVILPGLHTAGEHLMPGQQVAAHCTIKGKHFVFETTYLGPASIALTDEVGLPCQQFTVPSQMEVIQRRRTFRIEPQSRIVAELDLVSDPESSLVPQPGVLSSGRRKTVSDAPGSMGILGQVADLSFSGVRVTAPQDHLCKRFAAGDIVYCRMAFPGEPAIQMVPAQIRRIATVMHERNEWHDTVGLEFLVRDESHRRVIEFIRQYVLAEQRAELARRVTVVSGSDSSSG